MTRNWMTALVLAASVLSSGCYFENRFVDPKVPKGEEHDPWVHFFLWGLVGEEDIDVRQYCHGDVAEVAFGSNLGTGVVSLLTLGIYSPRKIYVTCAADGHHALSSGRVRVGAVAPTRPAR